MSGAFLSHGNSGSMRNEGHGKHMEHRDGSFVSGCYNPAGAVEPEQQWGVYSLKELTGLLD